MNGGLGLWLLLFSGLFGSPFCGSPAFREAPPKKSHSSLSALTGGTTSTGRMGLSRFQTFNDPPTAPGSLLIAEKVPSSLLRGEKQGSKGVSPSPGNTSKLGFLKNRSL